MTQNFLLKFFCIKFTKQTKFAQDLKNKCVPKHFVRQKIVALKKLCQILDIKNFGQKIMFGPKKVSKEKNVQSKNCCPNHIWVKNYWVKNLIKKELNSNKSWVQRKYGAETFH